MFEKASRLKLRFDTPAGSISVEDLWDLPLQTRSAHRFSLDSIAVELHGKIQLTNVVSFVTEDVGPDEETVLKFEIVKHVIDVKKKEASDALHERQRAETKQKLLEVLARKRDNEVEALSVEEIEKRIAEL